MNNLIEVLKYFGPLIGVFIGWMLTRKSDKDKLVREDKRKLKQTLKTLLDLRYEIKLVRRDEDFINIYVETVKIKFGELNELDTKQTNQIIDLLKKMIDEAGLTITKQTSKTTKENFEKAVNNLSEIDPILAYRLNGKQNIQEFFGEWEEISKRSLEEIVSDKDEIKKMIQQFRPKLLNEAIMDLDSVLTEIATQIDNTTLSKTKEIIAEKDIYEKQIAIHQFVERVFS